MIVMFSIMSVITNDIFIFPILTVGIYFGEQLQQKIMCGYSCCDYSKATKGLMTSRCCMNEEILPPERGVVPQEREREFIGQWCH